AYRVIGKETDSPASKHPPENAVEDSRLSFIFKASVPVPKTTEPVAASKPDQSTASVPVALW
ncbi:MAG: hypothetical protein WA902_08535, partial [Thermosynechococcaceae cyanobacterium]